MGGRMKWLEEWEGEAVSGRGTRCGGKVGASTDRKVSGLFIYSRWMIHLGRAGVVALVTCDVMN